jgi:hypothetical protein
MRLSIKPGAYVGVGDPVECGRGEGCRQNSTIPATLRTTYADYETLSEALGGVALPIATSAYSGVRDPVECRRAEGGSGKIQ